MHSLTLLLAAAAVETAKLPEPTSYSAIGWLVVGIGALVTALNQVDAFVMRHRSQPPAGELQITADAIASRLGGMEHKYDVFRQQCEERHRGLGSEEAARRAGFEAKMDALRIESKNDIKALEAKLDSGLFAINSANEQRASEMHERINKILAAVSEVRGELNRFTSRK